MDVFLLIQRQKIDIEMDIWSKLFVIDWVENNAMKFREAWDASICRKCLKCLVCGVKVKKNCNEFVG